ncbi:MAG TPA: glutathione S-transferase family protein [Pseudomonadales bacterium]
MSSNTARIIGSYISPYVRKVLVALDVKGIAYEIDPIIPFMGDDAFSRLSPVRRVPVLIDERVTLADSSVICQYLEDRYPTPALYPADVADRARARWLEEYADTRIGEVFIWRLFNQRVINRFVWGEQPDQAVIDRAISQEIPDILDYLEPIAPNAGFMFGDALSIADISIAAFFRNAAFARYSVDAQRWPKVAAYIARVLDAGPFVRLRAFEDLSCRTPIDAHREALRQAGAPIMAESFGTSKPRRGVLQI